MTEAPHTNGEAFDPSEWPMPGFFDEPADCWSDEAELADPEWFLDLAEGTLEPREERELHRRMRRDRELGQRFAAYQASVGILGEIGACVDDAEDGGAELRAKILAKVAPPEPVAARPPLSRRALAWWGTCGLAAAAAIFAFVLRPVGVHERAETEDGFVAGEPISLDGLDGAATSEGPTRIEFEVAEKSAEKSTEKSKGRWANRLAKPKPRGPADVMPRSIAKKSGAKKPATKKPATKQPVADRDAKVAAGLPKGRKALPDVGFVGERKARRLGLKFRDEKAKRSQADAPGEGQDRGLHKQGALAKKSRSVGETGPGETRRSADLVRFNAALASSDPITLMVVDLATQQRKALLAQLADVHVESEVVPRQKLQAAIAAYVRPTSSNVISPLSQALAKDPGSLVEFIKFSGRRSDVLRSVMQIQRQFKTSVTTLARKPLLGLPAKSVKTPSAAPREKTLKDQAADKSSAGGPTTPGPSTGGPGKGRRGFFRKSTVLDPIQRLLRKAPPRADDFEMYLLLTRVGQSSASKAGKK